MADNRNFAALEWVTGEIDETLKQARQALEAYVENPQDSTRIRFCLTHIHQVHGSLQMVEFYGAALMAEEMENLAEAMMNDRVKNAEEAQEVLMRAILQFPLYLDKVQSTRRDHPVMVLPLLNDLRTVRGESLLTETKLFTPNLAAARNITGSRLPQAQDNLQFLAMMEKFAKMYQYAAAAVLRGVKLDENLAYLVKVFDRLHKLTQGTAKQSLWKIALVLAEGLENDSIEFSASIKNLLRQINHEIKILQKHGIKALDVCASEELLKNLLYYIARAGLPEGSSANAIQAFSDYDLASSMPDGGEIATAEDDDLLAAPDAETMRSVVSALKDELDTIKHVLDVSLSGIGSDDSVEQVLPIMQRVSDTMAVLGIGNLRKQVQSQCEILSQAAENKDNLSHDLLMSVASSIIEIENNLDAVAAGHTDAVVNNTVGASVQVDQAQASVLRESRSGLEHAKDAIVEYIASQWNNEHLESVPATLREIRGGLDIIPLHRPAKILGACARYIEEKLLQGNITPDWSTLDTLADAITSVEYYLERISSERRDDDEMLLTMAEESVESLGYAVTSSNIHRADNDSAEYGEAEDNTVGVNADEPQTAEEIPETPVVEEVSDEAAIAVVESLPLAETTSEPEVETAPPVELEIGPEVELESAPEPAPIDLSKEDEEDEIDEEILEIFIEEAEEVTETIAEFFPRWKEDREDHEAMAEFRRAFHTLKGSGRMVGASDIGELAWSVENMLNRVIDGTVTANDDQCELIENVRAILPELIVAFRDRQPNPQQKLCTRYMAIGEALAKGPLPEEFKQSETTDEIPAESIEEVAAVEVETKIESVEDEDSDSLLWEIFGTEAQGHLSVVEEFVAEMQQAAPIYLPPSDAMQRALHTLKGSAHMAGVTPIAELATPLEGFAKELRSYQINIDDDILQLLRDAVSYTRIALNQIERNESVSIAQLPQFCARVAELRELHIAPLVRHKDTLKDGQLKIDPQLLEIFMAEEMNLLLDAEQLLDDCQHKRIGVESLLPLKSELQTLQLGAEHANLPSMAELSNCLYQAYVAVDEKRCECNEEHCETFKDGHNQLLNMVDAVAAGQTLPEQDAELIQRLTALGALNLASVENVSEGAADIEVEQDIESAEVISIADYSPDDLSVSENIISDEVVEVDDSELSVSDETEADSINLEDIVIEDDDLDLDNESSAIEPAGDEELTTEQIAASEPLESGLVDIDLDELADTEEVIGAEVTESSDAEEPFNEDSVASETEFDELAGTEEVIDAEAVESGNTEGVFSEDTVESESEAETQSADIDFAEPLEDAAAEAETAVELESLAEDNVPTDDALVEQTPIESSEQSDAVNETADAEEPVLAALDEDFDEDIVEIFFEEANELLEEMEHAIHAWESDWSSEEPADELKRILHTLKGGARLAGMVQVGDLSHDFETMIIAHTGDVDAGMISNIHGYQDKLLKSIENVAALLAGETPAPIVEEPEPIEPTISEALPSVEEQDSADTDVAEATSEAVAPAETPQSGADIIPFIGKAKNKSDNSDPAGISTAPTFVPPHAAHGVAQMGGAPQLAAKRSGPQEVVKVSAELLEELVNLAGETSITRGRMEEQVSELGGAVDEMESTIHRLQEQLRRLDIETEAQISFREEQLSEEEEFDPLEMDRYSALQQLSRSLIESASDLMDLKTTLSDKTRDSETLLLQQSRINTELQEGLMRSRMVPFSRLVPRLRRIVRQVATELGKHVNFELDNIEGELDRSVLERMVAPLEHMLRNAVDHGIELPSDRLAANKSETGRVILSLAREGGEVVLRLVDDGRGIDLERVRAKAIERGLMTENSALSDQDVMQFILHAGFSTAQSVSQISGRGVGMDVVHSEIKQLGGVMLINSRKGQGTEFTVRLPFTVSVNRALMVQIGDDRYAIPLNTIEGIVRVSPFELEHYYQDEQARFEYAGENYQMRYLGSMLSAGARPKLEDQVLPLPVVLVRSAEHTVAVQVDRLMGSREIVVKTLGPQFGSVMGLSGATVMGDGSVVVILDPHAMIRKEALLAAAETHTLEPINIVEEEVVDSALTVMVVDDSVTVRKVTSRFLEREGYNVMTAKDGREALQVLQDHVPDVMLLDIEMPRMDGFEVAKNVRSSSRLKDLPIIMITSRTGDKHRERAMSLGVNKYMGKPFQEEILLGNIRALSGEPESE